MLALTIMLNTLLNASALIAIGLDLAVAPKSLPKWNMPLLFFMAFVFSLFTFMC